MAIDELTKKQFLDILNDKLSPSSPIQSVEHLYGREAQLRQIDSALSSPGRHVFVYGDRGVGKTSLAQTAAFNHENTHIDPVLISCNRSTSLFEIVEIIAARLLQAKAARKSADARSGKFSTLGRTDSAHSGAIPKKITSFNTAVEHLREVATAKEAKALVVVDEFDLLPDAEKEQFADFIKQVGDRRIAVQFIFCGIGESMDELLGAHASSYRYLEGIQVPRLRFGARLDIIKESSKALEVEIPETYRFRIAAISDGFPHYVHLICEKLYWEVFYDERKVSLTTREHYLAAIHAATTGIQQQLRRAYDKATMKDTDDNHLILWAAADHPNLVRRKSDIWESYQRIARTLDEEPLSEDQFYKQLATLKSAAAGRILRGQSVHARNWYQFSESIVRGYVRLRAEEQGVMLATEYTDPSESEVTARPKRTRPVRGWRRNLYSS